jgi:hypothetical protein
MIFVYLLALIGLLGLLALSVVAVLIAARPTSRKEPEDSFDLALSAVARLQSSAWRAVQELRELDGHRK